MLDSAIEQVAAIPRTLADRLGLLTHGFSALPTSETLDAMCRGARFLPRPEAEEDPSHKQLIPYGVVLRGGRVFCTRRLGGGGEARLHGKLSVGIGGHLNPPDRDDCSVSQLGATALLDVGMRRELDEELVVAGDYRVRAIGLINDDETAVGRVHLGVVYRVDVAETSRVEVRETETLHGDFVEWSHVANHRDRLESWSAFVLDAHRAGALLADA